MITPGYITMQEAIEATPLSYLANRALLPNLLQILVLFLTVLFDPYILRKQRKFMFAIIALELSLIGQDLISAYLNTHNLPPLLRPKPRRTPGSGNVDASYLRTLRKDLNDTFSEAGCADVLINACSGGASGLIWWTATTTTGRRASPGPSTPTGAST